MPSFKSIFASSALLALAQAHGVILGAQGEAGSPPSVGFQVDPEVARNCTTINPCQQDSTIIRDAEIKANVVNSCGRTSLSGNIDVGENTENAITGKAVTKVKAGGELTVTIHQVNADGAGPYLCDLDESSNTGIGFVNLTVNNNIPGTNGLSQAKAQAFNITVKLPDDMKCFGASTGNICTVRCRNTAVAGPFGGCFPIEQVDVQPSVNSPQNIKTLESLDEVLAKTSQNQADFPVAVKANAVAGSDEAKQNLDAVNAILGNAVPTTTAFAVETPNVDLTRPQPAAPTNAAGGNQGGNNGGNNGNQGGNRGGNRGGNQGGNRGGNQGGNQGNNNGAQGGNQGNNNGAQGGNQGNNNGGQGGRAGNQKRNSLSMRRIVKRS